MGTNKARQRLPQKAQSQKQKNPVVKPDAVKQVVCIPAHGFGLDKWLNGAGWPKIGSAEQRNGINDPGLHH